MKRQPAVSLRALLRGFALVGGLFVLLVGSSCGRETFDLLAPDAGGPNGGALDGAGPSVNAGGGRGGSGGMDRDAGPSKGGGNTNGGGGGGSGEPQGGSDKPCLPGDSCIDGGVRCPPTVALCKRCTTQNDCGRDGPPFCDPADGRCVECFPGQADCKPGENCDPTFLRCAKACLSSSDCGQDHRYCDPSRGVCVDCLTSSHCAIVPGEENYRCAAGFCVECLDNAACGLNGVCLSFHCVSKQ